MITKLGTARNADVEVEEPGGLERVVAEVLFERPQADQSPWLLVVPSGPPSMSRVYESLLTVADGITGTRGSLEEDGTDASPAVFVSGLYDTRDGGAESLLVVRSWTTLALNRSFSTGERGLDLLSGAVAGGWGKRRRAVLLGTLGVLGASGHNGARRRRQLQCSRGSRCP